MMMASCAEQGTAMMIIEERMIFSLRDFTVRTARMAGTLHPMPTIMGMNDPPWRPKWCIMLSRSTTALVRYPESSRMPRMM